MVLDFKLLKLENETEASERKLTPSVYDSDAAA